MKLTVDVARLLASKKQQPSRRPTPATSPAPPAPELDDDLSWL